MLRAAGIVALIVLTACTACGQSSSQATPTPTPAVASGNWTQNLTFTGEVNGQMKAIVPDSGSQQSQCTGSRTHSGETWADYFFGTVDASGNVWGVVFVIKNFRGPGTYANTSVTVQVHSADNSQVWQSSTSDKVVFVVDRNQQSGTINATMTNAATGKSGVRLTGRWNCRE